MAIYTKYSKYYGCCYYCFWDLTADYYCSNPNCKQYWASRLEIKNEQNSKRNTNL